MVTVTTWHLLSSVQCMSHPHLWREKQCLGGLSGLQSKYAHWN